jgi:pyrroloquinoline quinone biosynthesis protein D
VTPRLAPHSSVRYNEARGEWLMMLPEAVVVLNETAAAVLNLVDGERTVDAIVEALGADYEGVEAADVEDLLRGLADQHLVVLS